MCGKKCVCKGFPQWGGGGVDDGKILPGGLAPPPPPPSYGVGSGLVSIYENQCWGRGRVQTCRIFLAWRCLLRKLMNMFIMSAMMNSMCV